MSNRLLLNKIRVKEAERGAGERGKRGTIQSLTHTGARASATYGAVGDKCHGVVCLSFLDPARYTPSGTPVGNLVVTKFFPRSYEINPTSRVIRYLLASFIDGRLSVSQLKVGVRG